jgi:hypothetical protein
VSDATGRLSRGGATSAGLSTTLRPDQRISSVVKVVPQLSLHVLPSGIAFSTSNGSVIGSSDSDWQRLLTL